MYESLFDRIQDIQARHKNQETDYLEYVLELAIEVNKNVQYELKEYMMDRRELRGSQGD